ncbi:MAG: hypothetical protein IKS05_07310 [Oscillospiraceae bacterium]|nr:hypothetical protein [Oscillospiraceae bacterium]
MAKTSNSGQNIIRSSDLLDSSAHSTHEGLAAVDEAGGYASGKRPRRVSLIIALILVAAPIVYLVVSSICSCISYYNSLEKFLTNPTGEMRPAKTLRNVNLDRFGATLYLRETEPGLMELTTGGEEDVAVNWSEDYNGYYYTSGHLRLLWYNTNVTPNRWQYWYAPISAEFGEYGALEYRDDGWYVETAEGNWSPVPERYDTAGLWHIAPTE